jgi:hypothetical protein
MTDLVFKANCVAVQENEEYTLIGFSDDEFNVNQYLIIQFAKKFDKQDKENGIDTYHIELNNEAQSCYGGIEKVQKNRGEICFIIKEDYKRIFKLNQIVVYYQINTDKEEELNIKLHEIFGESIIIINRKNT